MSISKKETQVRFAVVGLGHFAQTAILPAFANATRKATLAALVTGDPKKSIELSRKYHAPAFGYEAFDDLCRSGDIDAVYIALPNSRHREFTERAANAGRHVLCEKPLAYTVEDAEAMVAACREAQVRLMTAYRLHFEEANLKAIEALRSKKIGAARLLMSVHTMQVDPDNIRVDRSLGGGPLEDIGIYCINAARYLFRAEPEEVAAFAVHGDDERFEEVPEAVSAIMRFPGDRLATFLCGFGETKVSEYRVIGTKGVLEMNPAYTWQGDIQQTLSVQGKIKSRKTFQRKDQVAAEIVYFSDCVLKGQEPEPSGEEGLLDVRIIDALRNSYMTDNPIRLSLTPSKPRPDLSQAIKRSTAKKPKPVNASPPSKE